MSKRRPPGHLRTLAIVLQPKLVWMQVESDGLVAVQLLAEVKEKFESYKCLVKVSKLNCRACNL